MGILLITQLILPTIFYLVAWHLARREGQLAELAGRTDAGQTRGPAAMSSPAQIVLGLALIAHLVCLYLATIGPQGIRVGFGQVLSAALFIAAALLWLERSGPRNELMQTLVLPLAALAAPLSLLFPGALVQSSAHSSLFIVHMVVGILSYAVMLLALVHATMMAMAERSLQGGSVANPSALNRLPPLLSMERMLFRLLAIGFVLLSLTAVTGIFFSEQTFGQAFVWDHKTVFTVLAWLVFGALLLGRYWRGWRGRTALRLTVFGFVVLLLGYVGSRFVLEVVLGRVA